MLCSGLYGAARFSKGIGITHIINAEVIDYQFIDDRKNMNSFTQNETVKNEKVIIDIEREEQKEIESAAQVKENQFTSPPKKPKSTNKITPFASLIESAEEELANYNIAAALEKYHQVASGGFIPAYISIGSIYHKQGNYKKAWRWYLKAAEAGDSTGEYFVAIFYKEGLHVKPSARQAFKYFEKSANHGNVSAMLLVAQAYEKGIGCERDKKKAIEYLVNAANKDFPEAQYRLEIIFQTEKDMSQAAEWFQKAYSHGHPNAKQKLHECISQMPFKQRIKWRLHQD